mmetsp:Transcript_62197/g.181594  ORF Transcript_62197/g.181594 Transcript_62197/m.181594 type:complete len:117 (+) Transcript_62197:2894-3244(+)
MAAPAPPRPSAGASALELNEAKEVPPKPGESCMSKFAEVKDLRFKVMCGDRPALSRDGGLCCSGGEDFSSLAPRRLAARSGRGGVVDSTEGDEAVRFFWIKDCDTNCGERSAPARL